MLGTLGQATISERFLDLAFVRHHCPGSVFGSRQCWECSKRGFFTGPPIRDLRVVSFDTLSQISVQDSGGQREESSDNKKKGYANDRGRRTTTMSASHSVRYNAVALCNLVRSLSSADASSDAHRKMLDEVDPQALARGITSDYVKLLIFLLGGFSSQVTASLASYNLGSVEGDDGRFLAKVYSLSVKALKVNIKVKPFSYRASPPIPSHISFLVPMPSLA